MCHYTYTLFECGHGKYIDTEDIEFCLTFRLLSTEGPSPFDALECPATTGICTAVNEFLCFKCGESQVMESRKE